MDGWFGKVGRQRIVYIHSIVSSVVDCYHIIDIMHIEKMLDCTVGSYID